MSVAYEQIQNIGLGLDKAVLGSLMLWKRQLITGPFKGEILLVMAFGCALVVCPPRTPPGLGMMPAVDTDAGGSSLDSAAIAHKWAQSSPWQSQAGVLGGRKVSVRPCRAVLT